MYDHDNGIAVLRCLKHNNILFEGSAMQFVIHLPAPLVPPKVITPSPSSRRRMPSQLVVLVLLLMFCP